VRKIKTFIKRFIETWGPTNERTNRNAGSLGKKQSENLEIMNRKSSTLCTMLSNSDDGEVWRAL
jgi:hypothetical protein